MLTLLIGNRVYSSWSLRGWLALKQSGLKFTTQVIPLYDDAWETRRRAGDMAVAGGKLPVLWDDGLAVWDSLAIMAHVDGLSGGTRFWPREKAARALAWSMVAEMHSGFAALRQACPMNLRAAITLDPSDEVLVDTARIMALWTAARQQAEGSGPFLFGDFGAADIAFAPVVFRFRGYGLALPEDAKRYCDAVLAHPFMAEWIADAKTETWHLPRYDRQDSAR